MKNNLLKWKVLAFSFFIISSFHKNAYSQQVKLPTDTTFSENLSMNPNRDLYPGETFDINFKMTGFPPGTIYIALMHKSDEEINIGTTTTGTPIHAKIPLDAAPGKYGIKVVAASAIPGRPKTIIIRDSLLYKPQRWTKVSGNEPGKLQFTGTGERVATSKPVDFATGGFIQVDFRWLQTNTTANSDVYIEFSTNNGASWTQAQKLSTTINYTQFIHLDFPSSATSDHTMVRLRQPNYVAGKDGWKIDLILLDKQGNVIMPNYYENIHFSVAGPDILVSTPENNSICAGQETSFKFTTKGTFPDGNNFTAQISQKNGSFETTKDIGTLASKTGGTINVKFPTDLVAGNLYKVRLIAIANGKYISTSDPTDHLELGEFLNPQLTRNTNTLTAPKGNSYQWLKDRQVIDGATSQQFEVTESGSYSCSIVSLTGCNFTTQELSMDLLSTQSALAKENFNIFPNPTSDKIILSSLNALQGSDLKISLINSLGVNVLNEPSSFDGTEAEIILSDLPKGMYYLVIDNGKDKIMKPVMKY